MSKGADGPARAFEVFDAEWSRQAQLRRASEGGVRETYWRDGYAQGQAAATEMLERVERLLMKLPIRKRSGPLPLAAGNGPVTISAHLPPPLCTWDTGQVYSGSAAFPLGTEAHKESPCFAECGQYAADGSVHVIKPCSETCQELRELQTLLRERQSEQPAKAQPTGRRFKRVGRHL